MSFYNIRDKFGRFAKVGESPRKNTLVKKAKKDNLVSRDYLVIDESSSMANISQQTVNSINEYIDNLKTVAKKVKTYCNMIKFSTGVGGVSSYKLEDFPTWVNGKHYKPNGLTALYDALATAINHAIDHYSKKEQVVITVITDGEENSSIEYPRRDVEKIRALVNKAKNEYNFTINYIGAGDFLSIQASAQNIGIFASNTTNYSADNNGVKAVMSKMSASRNASLVSYMDTGENTNSGFFSND